MIIKVILFIRGINWQYVYYKKYEVLGKTLAKRNDSGPIIYCQRKLQKYFIRNGNLHAMAVTSSIEIEREYFIILTMNNYYYWWILVFHLGYDFVSKQVSQPETITSKLENILGPNERSFDALYEQGREVKLQLYSKRFDCHMVLPKSQMKTVMKRWMTTTTTNRNNVWMESAVQHCYSIKMKQSKIHF